MPSLTLTLTAHGKVRLHEITDESDAVGFGQPIEAAVVDRIRAAFASSSGAGIYHLGSVEATTGLPPVLAFWRDFGREFMRSLCAVGDLAEHRHDVSLSFPQARIAGLIGTAPPMRGGEYLSCEVLATVWADVQEACRRALVAYAGTVEDYLHQANPGWNLVGRVHFHLAEQKKKPAVPFAFLATYTTGFGKAEAVRHKPLGTALREYAGDGDDALLGALLRPVHEAAQHSDLVRELVDTGRLFHPLGWSPSEAYRFLRDIPLFESSGIVVRVPDWWKASGRSRPQVRIEIGGAQPAGVGVDALLDFQVDVALDGEPLAKSEIDALLAAGDGLTLLRGRWVEVDRDKLNQALEHWRAVEGQAGSGLSFLDGMRLLAGTAALSDVARDGTATTADWSDRVAGDWLRSVLDQLQQPAAGQLDLEGELRATLRPYQERGVRWLWTLCELGLGGCLADDMGLGKTIQVLALLLLRRRSTGRQADQRRPCLLVVPASLIGNWRSEAERFAPTLRVKVVHPSVEPSAALKALDPEQLGGYDVLITSYGFVQGLPWAKSFEWDLIVLDEAQAIKNPGARQSRAVKQLTSRNRLALTGTPIENQLADLWSLFDFINPGLLGSAAGFRKFTKRLATDHRYGALRRLIQPYLLRRLKTDQSIIADLPDKTEVIAYCTLTKAQAALYQQSVATLAEQLETLEGMERRGVVLAFLARFKQICNHPSQWLKDADYDPTQSGKFARLAEIAETLAARQEKVLVFTQFREMTTPLARFLAERFGRPGLVLHGQTPVKKRAELVRQFQEDDAIPFFVLSLKAGGTGLNLTAASQVIHFDRWWNPAVENQATDRAFRIGQKNNVLVHKFVCRGTVEEKIESMLAAKRALSSELLADTGQALLTEMDNDELLAVVALDIDSALDAE